MYRSFKIFTLFLSLAAALGLSDMNAQLAVLEAPQQESVLFRPKLQMGIGHLSYFGDVGHLNGVNRSPQLNWGYNIMLRNPINEAFDLNVFALFGNVSSAERLHASEFNFSSSIRMGGISLSYNFDHFLPKDRTLTPYLSLGITTFEFNPKSNLQDRQGRPYHHWSDGSIMNMAEDHPDVAQAIPLEQDRTYETDLRSLENRSNQYALRAISVPLGAGVDIEINKNFALRLGAEFHFTNTDYIDGLAYDAGTGNGRSHNDRFLYSSFGMTYTLHHSKQIKTSAENSEIEGLQLSTESDEDGDGVVDFFDKCPGTPAGVSVDLHGCPLDSDGDGVADYLDDEPNSPNGAYVNELGVALTDQDFELIYKIYMGEGFAHNVQKSSTSTADVERNKVRMSNYSQGFRLTVVDMDILNAEQLEQLLSISDLKSVMENGKVIYYAGDYASTIEFLGATLKFKAAGLKYKAQYNKRGTFTDIDESMIFDGEDYAEYTSFFMRNETTFRVQVGAFSKAVSPKLFKDIPDVFVIPGHDGLTRYVSGSYDNIQDAAKHRVNLLLKGYEGAFVTVYRGGKRISLKEAGATVTKTEDLSQKAESSDQINKEFVRYAVQLGTYKGRIPAEMLGKYMTLGNVRPIRSDDGTTRYIQGAYHTIAEAKKAQEKLSAEGLKDTFLVGEFNGQLMTVEEAKKLKGQ